MTPRIWTFSVALLVLSACDASSTSDSDADVVDAMVSDTSMRRDSQPVDTGTDIRSLEDSGVQDSTPTADAGAVEDGSPSDVVSVDGGPVGRPSGLVALYTFDEAEGATVRDVSGVAPALDLTMYGSGVRRIGGGVVFELTDNPIIVSDAPATKIVNAVKASDEITIALWLRATRLSQDGPARIFGLALRNHHRNLSILHGPALCHTHDPGSHYQVRVLNVGEDNGCDPIVRPADAPNVSLDLAHVVFTRGSDQAQRLYIDGVVSTEDVDTDANFDHWYDDVVLAIGNEPNGMQNASERDDGRRWQGELFEAAVYDRALTQEEVGRLFAQGSE